ncbi:MAG: PucR family transcriptional regulator [Oliverpabstia sp.]
MGLTVEELLKAEEFGKITLLCGEEGIKREIKGVTIIEAPDIVKFIDGGELLLTGLYAFKSSNLEEFRKYISELQKKEISGLVIKRGRRVEEAEKKIALLQEYAELFGIPLIEVPFEVSFQKIMSYVMERIFNEEVTRLKYFKTTHDNFSALMTRKKETSAEDILDMLCKLIRNPIALYNQNLSCYASAGKGNEPFTPEKNAERYNPGMITNYKYTRQTGEYTQYIVHLRLNVGLKMFLVITEIESEFGLMDCIAIENAIIALQYAFSRKFAVSELEKKYQNDILNNILNGKVTSASELKKSTGLLGIDPDGYYRVIVCGVASEEKKQKNLDEKLPYVNLLEEAVQFRMPNAKIQRDMDKVIGILPMDSELSQAECRKKLTDLREKVQEQVNRSDNKLSVKIGVGKMVKGIMNLQESYKEASDAFAFMDIAGEITEDGGSGLMMFSDLGIFKLLCQLNDPEQLLEYVPESLQKLYDYKKPQQDDLIETLRTYLNYNQNLSKTAQDLYVHYKTAAYRIEKIAKITGMDFNNANEMLAVRIGLVVYKMIENQEKK